jgi:5-methylcytosine-specific restriction endonuclease McrA
VWRNQYRVQKRDEFIAYEREYRSTHRELIATRQKSRYQDEQHPWKQQVLACNKRRRDRSNNLDADYTRIDEQITRSVFGHECFVCGHIDNLVIDHHYPLSLGFGLSLDNAVLLCRGCNGNKFNHTPEEFYEPSVLSKLEYILGIVSCDDLGVY